MSAAYQPVALKDLPEALTALETADRAELLDYWRDLAGAPPPKNLSLPFLRRAVAFELQCQVRGGPKARMIEDLNRIAAGSASRASVGTKLRPGSKLIREWQGRTWTIEVTDGGFLMAGERYVSLSAIARKITGARWSGPRFFGLTGDVGQEATTTKPSHRGKAA